MATSRLARGPAPSVNAVAVAPIANVANGHHAEEGARPVVLTWSCRCTSCNSRTSASSEPYVSTRRAGSPDAPVRLSARVLEGPFADPHAGLEKGEGVGKVAKACWTSAARGARRLRLTSPGGVAPSSVGLEHTSTPRLNVSMRALSSEIGRGCVNSCVSRYKRCFFAFVVAV